MRDSAESVFTVMTTSWMAFERIVGKRTPIVAFANEYVWYPRNAGHGGLFGSTGPGVLGYIEALVT